MSVSQMVFGQKMRSHFYVGHLFEKSILKI
jgi:hypothetical protein